VATLAESGLPDFRTEFIMGVVAPAGTPREIVDLLNRRIVAILKLPDVQERLKTLGYEPVGSTPDEFAARIKADSETWSKVVRQAAIKIE
jgi:tripartite-type tricarboxylate transporter receptor subunit TctC